MRFSMAKLLVAMLLLNVLVCLTFAAPAYIGYPILTLISLIIIPPAILVGVVNTRGPRQAFFLGCMVAGLPHFIFSVYIAVMLVFSFSDVTFSTDDESDWLVQLTHLGGYFLGMLGGLSGVGAYFLIVASEKDTSDNRVQLPVEKDEPIEFPNPAADELDASRPVVRTPK